MVEGKKAAVSGRKRSSGRIHPAAANSGVQITSSWRMSGSLAPAFSHCTYSWCFWSAPSGVTRCTTLIAGFSFMNRESCRTSTWPSAPNALIGKVTTAGPGSEVPPPQAGTSRMAENTQVTQRQGKSGSSSMEFVLREGSGTACIVVRDRPLRQP
jgi:hypothetical protein